MDKKKRRKITSNILTVCLCLIAILIGYLTGGIINKKYFIVDKYAGLTEAELVDDLTKIDIKNKTPDQLNGALVFQIAANKLKESTYYEVVGIGEMKTSVGVTQSSHTIDTRDGDNLSFIFNTYSSLIKSARKCNYKINGDLTLYEGKSNSSGLDNIEWTDKSKTYSWEEFHDTFGKYANVHCTYIISTKTALDISSCKVENGTYTYTIELDPLLSTIGYVKNIAYNVGIDYKTVQFSKVQITFTVDKNFMFIDQKKIETYTMPYGVEVQINGTYDVDYKYSK